MLCGTVELRLASQDASSRATRVRSGRRAIDPTILGGASSASFPTRTWLQASQRVSCLASRGAGCASAKTCFSYSKRASSAVPKLQPGTTRASAPHAGQDAFAIKSRSSRSAGRRHSRQDASRSAMQHVHVGHERSQPLLGEGSRHLVRADSSRVVELGEQERFATQTRPRPGKLTKAAGASARSRSPPLNR